ncbi:hypothetical protein AciPR4_3099 [Terriglobus saanensis SP1PR4]|uniref:Uncharacterized protein n=2 Tax=Terriglobus saanensis TaxID=870903 RepID=E8V6Q5_TERSS|nr:hypothetical protein AciPR4_3099 [Terriglobus saanensis SP1PR4]
MLRRTPLNKVRERPRRKGKAMPKPAVRIMRDGREICTETAHGRAEYRRRRDAMWSRDHGICCICGTHVDSEDATFEHWEGRGMNGGHRDDRIERDGKPYNGIAHELCNSLKGSRRQS